MFEPDTLALAENVLALCRARGWHVATAESFTGGLVATALTAIAGSSDVVDQGFVTYSNEAMLELLGVPPATLQAHGAVSAETAAAMAQAPLRELGSISPRRSPALPVRAAPVPRSRLAWSISASRAVTAPTAPNTGSSPATALRSATLRSDWRSNY